MIEEGSSVYIVSEDHRTPNYYRTVISIGRKYITVADNISYSRFDKVTHKSVDDKTGWNPRLKLYESKTAYEHEIYEAACINRYKKQITDLLDKVPVRTLENIYKILRQDENK